MYRYISPKVKTAVLNDKQTSNVKNTKILFVLCIFFNSFECNMKDFFQEKLFSPLLTYLHCTNGIFFICFHQFHDYFSHICMYHQHFHFSLKYIFHFINVCILYPVEWRLIVLCGFLMFTPEASRLHNLFGCHSM